MEDRLTRYALRQSLPVLDGGDQLRVGTLPPNALTIEDPPPYLAPVLRYFSVPRSEPEAIEEVMRLGGVSEGLARLVIGELLDAGVLTTTWGDNGGRYARHELYFDLIAEGRDVGQRLRASTVGLVGMGGIGSNVATILAAAGVGHLVFSDGDRVELSNLTRQYLYTEADVGREKVQIAARELAQINREVRLTPIPCRFDGPQMLIEHFAGCDLVILSADAPPRVHTWINDAARACGWSYSNAGYIDTFGVVGPLVSRTTGLCPECYPGRGDIDRDALSEAVNLNEAYQAPSYGPLNALVAALQANEALRFLIGLPVATAGKRLLIDSETYRRYEEEFDLGAVGCSACQAAPGLVRPVEHDLSSVYEQEREQGSFGSLLLDGLGMTLVEVDGKHVLDVGCGTGEQARGFARNGADVVAVDPSGRMLQIARQRAERDGVSSRIEFLEADLLHACALARQTPYDIVVCSNVLDHMADLDEAVRALAEATREGGQLLVTVPHPVKDGGTWSKSHYDGRWRYDEFVLNDYFNDGPVSKSREDAQGNILIPSILTYHRTIETYVRAFGDAGLQVLTLREPRPDQEGHDSALPILVEKAARVPYFLVFVLSRKTPG